MPKNNVKRSFLLLKVTYLVSVRSLNSHWSLLLFLTLSIVFQSAYNIGGHTISVDTIQSCILGCRMPRPRQVSNVWFSISFLQRLFSSRCDIVSWFFTNQDIALKAKYNEFHMQWLRLLLSSRTKFKTGDERQAYIIDRPEPLLHFALCSGSHSDPAVIFELTAPLFLFLFIVQ